MTFRRSQKRICATSRVQRWICAKPYASASVCMSRVQRWICAKAYACASVCVYVRALISSCVRLYPHTSTTDMRTVQTRCIAAGEQVIERLAMASLVLLHLASGPEVCCCPTPATAVTILATATGYTFQNVPRIKDSRCSCKMAWFLLILRIHKMDHVKPSTTGCEFFTLCGIPKFVRTFSSLACARQLCISRLSFLGK